MWIIKTHISISVLCWLSMKCMRVLFKDKYKRYKRSKEKSKRIERVFLYICPILNIVAPVIMLYMAFASDSFVEEVNNKLD